MNAETKLTVPQQRSSWRGRVFRRVLAAVFIIGVGIAAVWGFVEGSKERALEAERERPVTAPLRVSSVDGDPVITLDAETQKRSGIETTVLLSAPYQDQVRAYGTVLDLAQLTDLGNNYATAKAQLQMVQAKLAASKAAAERARGLYKDQQNVSQAVAQAAEATFGADRAALAVAESQLRTLSATTQQNWGPVVGKALLDGTPLVTRLIERQEFLLQITLPPGVSLPAPPQTASVQVGNGPRAEIKLISPATRTDPKIQGASFFYVAAADSGVLPGMNVLAFLPLGAAVNGVLVPSAAIVWWADRAWMYRRAGPETFTRSEIATDLPARDGSFVVKGVPADTQAVTSGTQMLLSEEFRAQIQVGVDQK